MDLYQIYRLRESGEKEHRAQTPTEQVTFAVVDWLTARGYGHLIPPDRIGAEETLQSLHDQCHRAMWNFRS